jgi:hypothetical protein
VSAQAKGRNHFVVPPELAFGHTGSQRFRQGSPVHGHAGAGDAHGFQEGPAVVTDWIVHGSILDFALEKESRNRSGIPPKNSRMEPLNQC